MVEAESSHQCSQFGNSLPNLHRPGISFVRLTKSANNFSTFKGLSSIFISFLIGNLIEIYGKTIAGRYETLDFDVDYIDG